MEQLNPRPPSAEAYWATPKVLSQPDRSTHVLSSDSQRRALRLGMKQVLAAARDHKLRQPLKTPADRSSRNSKVIGPAENGISGVARANKITLLDPLRLDELELPPKVCTDEGEYQTAISAVVLQNAVRQQGAVGSAAPDHAMDADDHGHFCVARIHASHMGAGRCLVAKRIVFLIEEVIVAPRVGSQRRIVVERAARQGSAAPPAPHHLGRQQFLLTAACGVRLQILAERSHPLIQLPEGEIGAVATEDRGLSKSGGRLSSRRGTPG